MKESNQIKIYHHKKIKYRCNNSECHGLVEVIIETDEEKLEPRFCIYCGRKMQVEEMKDDVISKV